MLSKPDLLILIQHQFKAIVHMHPRPIGAIIHIHHLFVLIYIYKGMIHTRNGLIPREIDVVIRLSPDCDFVVRC